MTKRSGHSLPPAARRRPTPLPVRRGPFGAYDPFDVFERMARDNGSAYKSPEPKRQQQLLALLEGKAALMIMLCLLLFVVAGLLAVVIVRL